jgi:membrane-associated phospholipid phosphatase
MTEQDHPAVSTHGPETPGRVRGRPAERSPSRTVRRPIPAWLHLLGFAVVYLVAVCTPFGQRAENALMSHNSGAEAWFWGWSGIEYDSFALPPMDETALPSLLVGVAVIVVVTVVRRCWWSGCAAIGVVIVAFGGIELFHAVVLPRPDLIHAPAMLIEPSFPSGHAAVPAVLTLGAALVASPRIRPYIIAVGMVWFAVTAGGVQALYIHRPSDVLGATLWACACYSLAVRLLPPSAVPGVTRVPRALPAIVLALSAAGALVASGRDDSVSGPLVFAVVAFLCAALLGYTTAQVPADTAGRTRPAVR